MLQYVRWGRLPPSYKINGSSNPKNNGTLWSKKSDSKSDSQNLSSKSLSMWRQWFFEILKSLRASKKDAFKKIFKCNFKNLRSKLLTKHDFSQYPGDPSFSFLCQKIFFWATWFFYNFFWKFHCSKKKNETWNFKNSKVPSNAHVRVFLNDFQGILTKLNPWFLNQNHQNSEKKNSKNSCQQILCRIKKIMAHYGVKNQILGGLAKISAQNFEPLYF